MLDMFSEVNVLFGVLKILPSVAVGRRNLVALGGFAAAVLLWARWWTQGKIGMEGRVRSRK